MNWLDKLERKFHGKGIPYLTRYLIFASLIGYILSMAGQTTILNYMVYNPAMIFRGQIWRLVTWIFIPESSGSVWTLIFLLCLLLLGNSLERALGTFRMTVYYIGGLLISDIGGILVYLIFGVPIYLTLYYILFSLYLMLGLFMPDAEVRLYFVLPIKMKWMMLVYALSLGYTIYTYFHAGAQYGMMLQIGFMYSSEIIFALINLFIFVSACKRRMSFKQTVRQKQRQQQFRRQSAPAGSTGNTFRSASPVHKCCICGRTDQTNPELDFRFCSKCTGNREYCNDHLFTHQHR